MSLDALALGAKFHVDIQRLHVCVHVPLPVQINCWTDNLRMLALLSDEAGVSCPERNDQRSCKCVVCYTRVLNHVMNSPGAVLYSTHH